MEINSKDGLVKCKDCMYSTTIQDFPWNICKLHSGFYRTMMSANTKQCRIEIMPIAFIGEEFGCVDGRLKS